MRRVLFSMMFAVVALAGDGRTPRTSPSDYPAHADTKGATIAAVRITPEQINKIFPSDLSKKYVIVEVAIYPKDGSINVTAMDFVLKLPDTESRPENADEVAAMWRPHNNPHPDITNKTHVNTETGVIIGHGTDPVTGRPVTNAGTYERVGVSSGDDPNRRAPYPSASDVDADRFEAMLAKWSLPEGRTASPVAGYVYFPLPKSGKGKAKTYELQYSRDGASASLTLPASPK